MRQILNALALFTIGQTLVCWGKPNNYVKGMRAAMNQAQSQLDQRAQNEANREILDAGQNFAVDLTNYYNKKERLALIQQSLRETCSTYEKKANDPRSSEHEKNYALEKLIKYRTLISVLNIENIDDYSELHRTIVGY